MALPMFAISAGSIQRKSQALLATRYSLLGPLLSKPPITEETMAQLQEVPSVRQRVSDAEWQARVELAAAYRLVAHYGWTHLINNHISLRVPGTEEIGR